MMACRPGYNRLMNRLTALNIHDKRDCLLFKQRVWSYRYNTGCTELAGRLFSFYNQKVRSGGHWWRDCHDGAYRTV